MPRNSNSHFLEITPSPWPSPPKDGGEGITATAFLVVVPSCAVLKQEACWSVISCRFHRPFSRRAAAINVYARIPTARDRRVDSFVDAARRRDAAGLSCRG